VATLLRPLPTADITYLGVVRQFIQPFKFVMDEAAELCRACRRLNVEELTSTDGQIHYTEHSDPKTCPLCKYIFSVNRLKYERRKNAFVVRLKLEKTISNSGSDSMRIYAQVGNDDTVDTWAEAFTDPGQSEERLLCCNLY
jgi:hypothetical protein